MTRKTLTIILLALLFTGGGFFGAEASLPGDILYSVKKYINEPAISLIQITAKRQSAWRIEQYSRRLLEIERLSLRDQITTDNLASLKNTITTAHTKARQSIDKVLVKEYLDAAIDNANEFESIAIAHNLILKRLWAQYHDHEDEVYKDLTSLVDQLAVQASQTRENIEAVVLRKSENELRFTADNQLVRANEKIRTTRSLIESSRIKLGLQVIKDADNLLQLANEAIPEGLNRMDAGEFATAFQHFSTSLRYAQQAEINIQVAQIITNLEN